jgi:hypothetical protein
VAPVHEAPVLCVASHASPHALQFAVVLVDVSHPFVSGAVLSQSAKPVSHPVYEQLVPVHDGPLL